MALVELYFGRPGQLLTLIPCPQPGVPRSGGAHEALHELLGGGFGVDRSPNITRAWTYSYEWDDRAWWVWQAWYRRQYGPGPYALCDPGQINYLTGNQASATNAVRDTSGWSVAGGSSETVESSSTLVLIGDRSLKWALPASVTSGILTLTAPEPLLGWPTPNTGWAFSASLRLGAGDSSVNVALALRWLDATGAQVSETVAANTTIGPSAWSTLTVDGSPPATAVYVVPRVKVSAASVGSTAAVHVGQAQLQLGAVTDWRPGEGPALVTIGGVRETAALALADEHRRDVEVTIVELATEAV